MMILVVGCGFLGNYIIKHISQETKETLLATVRNRKNAMPVDGVQYMVCDVTKESDVSALAQKCKDEKLTVFYLAACHNIDFVYENPGKARKINVDALKSFIASMPKFEKFFFASTDCVYGDSDCESFSEKTELNPVNEYGRQKAEAEKIVLNSGYTVIRFPFLLGCSLSAKSHFYDKIQRTLLDGETVEMIDGMKRSVLSYSQAAELVYRLSLLPEKMLPDIINVCGDKTVSKYEMGVAIAQRLGVSDSLVTRISEEEGEKFFKDKRARCTSMDNTLLKNLLMMEKIEWKV